MTRFATLSFERSIAARPGVLWHAWVEPAARAIWSPPAPGVVIEYLSADPRVGGQEISLCKVAGEADIRCDITWLAMQPGLCSVNSEVISAEGVTLSAALVTVDIAPQGAGSLLTVTVQLASLGEDMEGGYRQGFAAALDNLLCLAEARAIEADAAPEGRTMRLERVIDAPVDALWQAWTDADALPRWWGPDGFSCRTTRIDLREGGEWVFDMIGPDGTVFPNHHRYSRHDRHRRIDYTLHWGLNGPKHADASARFDDLGGRTRITLHMVFATSAEYEAAKGFGAVELGQQTLGKLAAFVG